MIAFSIIILLLSAGITYLGYRTWFLAGVLADQQDEVDGFIGYISNLENTNLQINTCMNELLNHMMQ